MKTIRVQQQARLGALQVLEICGSGIYFRLFRSLVTVAVITVAIAFMMYMLGGSTVNRGVRQFVAAEAREYHLLEQWMTWLTEPMNRTALLRATAACAEGDFRFDSVKVWGGLSAAEAADLRDVARGLSRHIDDFGALPPGMRLVLAEESGGVDLLQEVADEAAFTRFAERLRQQGNRQMAGALDELHGLLRRYWAHIPLWDRVAQGRATAIARLQSHYPGSTVSRLLENPPPDFGAILAANGFAPRPTDLGPVVKEAQREVALNQWAALLRNRAFASALSDRARLPVTDLTLQALARVYLGSGGPAFVSAALTRLAIKSPLPSHEESVALFRGSLRRQLIVDIETASDASTLGQAAAEQRTLWLVGVAFVVCVVGIANAMLMSVMERFREIATMKCLGATDGFVMVLFVLESCVQGLAGGIAGAVLGLLVAVSQAGLQFGSILWPTLNFGDLAHTSMAALATGVILAGIASVYPAYVAARLAPMEAMRLE
jgi:hypothetical protein